MPLDTTALQAAAWPALAACATALDEARALADDHTRSQDERCAALETLADRAADAEMGRAYQACRKSITTKRLRNWSELLAYTQFSVAPIAKALGDAGGLSEGPRKELFAYCAAAHMLALIVDCRDDYVSRDRIFLPADLMRRAGVGADALGADGTSPGLRAVLDTMQDRIEAMLRSGVAPARAFADRNLRRATVCAIAERLRLSKKLRRRDPLAGKVTLNGFDRALVRLRASLWLWGRP